MTGSLWNLRAHRRVRKSPPLREHFETIFYDWPEGDEHLQWIATAPFTEIVDWAQEIEQAAQNEHDATGVDPARAV